MYALTLTAPWGSLVAIAATHPELGKHWETRGWAPRYPSWVGQFAIHQAAGLPRGFSADAYLETCSAEPFRTALMAAGIDNGLKMPTGRIVAVVTLAEVGRACIGYEGITPVPAVRWPDGRIENVPLPELAFGDYRPGRRIWRLADIVALPEPVEAKGSRSLWMLGPRAEAAVRAQLGAAS
jgi:hypothetical protein